MGRYRKDSTEDRLTARITALLTPAEREALEQAAAEFDMLPSRLARHWIMKGIRSSEEVRARLRAQHPLDQELCDELVQRGLRLNELARSANETQEIPLFDEIRAIAAELEKTLERIGSLPPGSKGVSDERRKLMNEVTRVGNNFMQIQKVAQVRGHAACLTLIDRFQDRMVECVKRMIAT